MASIHTPCEHCGRDLVVNVGQSISDERLVWYASYYCPHCGFQLEEDGFDSPPDEIRRAILTDKGVWTLIVHETGSRVILVLKVLRKALNLSLDDAAKLRKLIPGCVSNGTQAEMEWLRILLSSEQLEASVSKITLPFGG
jgi:large subunit ribosomal protein L7/L12